MSHKFYKTSPLDEIIPPLYNAFIYAFPCPATRQAVVLSTLEDAWSKTLVEQPVLASEVEFDRSEGVRPGSLILRIPESPEDSRIVVNDLTLPGSTWKDSYEELRAQGMPLSKLDGRVLAPLVSGVGSTCKVVTVQINLIRGGFSLSLCTSHSFVDAASNVTILEIWARHSRELQTLPGSPVSNSNQLPFKEMHSSIRKKTSEADYQRLKHRPELWHFLGLHATDNLDPVSTTSAGNAFRYIPAAMSPPGDPSTATGIFSITPDAMRTLKREATPDAPGWISSGDALVALLWRSIMQARFPPSSIDAGLSAKESIVTVAIDGRKLLSPPLPTSYIGNAVFCCMTSLSLGKLLSPGTSLAETALRLRRNIEAAKNPQFITDAVSLASSIPTVESLKIAFSDFLGMDLITTSWVDLPFYNIDFGPIFGQTGKAEFFRIPRGQFGGICSLQPRQTNEVIDIIIFLEVEQMGRLKDDEKFAKYVKFVSE